MIGCKECPHGKYVQDGSGKSIKDCLDCPKGTKTTHHAGYRACFCKDNYARKDRFGPCSICIEKGINCAGKEYRTIKTGFFWTWNFANANVTNYRKFVENLKTENWMFDNFTQYNGGLPRAFECPKQNSCVPTEDYIDVKCSDGYKGWLCSKCDRKFYSVLNQCIPCPSSGWFYTELGLVCCFCVIVLAGVVRLYKKRKTLTTPGRSIFDKIISRIKLVLGFYQVIGEFFASVHEVKWTKALKVVGDVISLIELNIFRVIIRPKCIDEKLQLNPKIEFVIGIMIPIALISTLWAIYWILTIRYKWKNRFTNASASIDSYKRQLKYNFCTSVIVVLFVTYPSICNTVFQLHPAACETFCLDIEKNHCKTLLRSDYDIDCKDLKIYHVFVYITMVVYVVGFPLVLYLLLRKEVKFIQLHGTPGPLHAINEEPGGDVQYLPDDSSTSTKPIWINFLCENYKTEYWYWEIVELSRKISQTALLTLLGWGNALTVLFTIGMSVVFLMLHARYRPMKSTFEQLLQMFSLTAILANVLVAIMYVPDEYDDRLAAALIVFNSLVIVITVGKLLFVYRLRVTYSMIGYVNF
ncbi:hypothetical protein HOLleu_03533 [Holothuria leucospilota]|uniref:Uncharacterized protein n=1 Tax=Holothuria leucospilota TaxID=206669 RepID=A0A9Q1CS27_HOLLE|nr:hypothetical protein HOLleu_03533 [Holothuria leucospilota]